MYCYVELLMKTEGQNRNSFEQGEDLPLEEASVPPTVEPSPVVEKSLKPSGELHLMNCSNSFSGLPRGKPGPKPKLAKHGRSDSPANPKISAFFSPKRSAAVLPSEEEEQVDEPSEPVVLKPRGPASRTGSISASRTGSTAASAKSAAPATVQPAHQSGMHPTFEKYIAIAAAAPVPSGPPKVISRLLHMIIAKRS